MTIDIVWVQLVVIILLCIIAYRFFDNPYDSMSEVGGNICMLLVLINIAIIIFCKVNGYNYVITNELK